MIRRPPRSTRTDTLFPYTTLFRSQRQRSAYFVLLSWLPMLALLFVRIGELYGLWLAPAWVGHAFPASFVLSGLVIMIGLSDSLLQLRRDRDRVSRLARFDALTGRSEERRFGKDGVSTGSPRGSPYY